MKLLIISNMAHYHDPGGQIVGWGPTVNEIDTLAQIFEEIRHIGCLDTGAAPSSALPYHSKNVKLIPVPPTGGDGLKDKFGILFKTPEYLNVLVREIRKADIVHVRCPANIPLLSILLLTVLSHPKLRWVKYAGNWRPDRREAWSYSFQRWWLEKGFSRALVTVNGTWPSQRSHVRSFFNPCLTEEEWQRAASIARQKQLNGTIRMIFAGRVESAKGMEMALQILAQLNREGVSVTLDVAGDGPKRIAFEQMAAQMKLESCVSFHGWIPRTKIGTLYAAAHIILLPTITEGWPKVLSEAMAYGVVPVASNVGSIGQYTHQFATGRTLPVGDLDGFVKAVRFYDRNPNIWKEESERGMIAAGRFTYQAYLNAVKNLLDIL